MPFETLMGDEAIALGALHAGLSSAYAYPGTPSTEIMESFQDWKLRGAAPGAPKELVKALVAEWCSNEKTAYESALGSSFAGRRAIVSMKHVGLNVAADPFVNSAIVKINGGLVVVVADDPSMHSSQNEQDSRVLADFARMPCLEPSDQQEAYDMARRAFDISEKYQTAVLIRITTRLAHSRSGVETREVRAANPIKKTDDPRSWILMPAIARKRWKDVLARQAPLREESEKAASLKLAGKKLGVITCGLGLQYYPENAEDAAAHFGGPLSHLHIGCYPAPVEKIKKLAAHVEKILVVEEGYPFLEDQIRGVFGAPIPVAGKRSGEIPLDGELTPDTVRAALGIPAREGCKVRDITPPTRPPQLCQGCPHGDSYTALNEALAGFPEYAVTSDIGCYTLGALPPYNAIESCVDMGASVGMARGAANAGLHPAVAVIGDSTFYHSGLTNLVDAVSHKTNMTLVILDNDTTAMTGAQPTIMPSSRLKPILEGAGVDPAHIKILKTHRTEHEKNVETIKAELAYEGPSVIVLVRECLEALKKARKA